MAVPPLVCGSETWTMINGDQNQIQRVEMKSLISVAG